VKRSFKIIALTLGFVAIIGVILPPWPQHVSSQEHAKSDNATYRFTLYCSRLYCDDLQDVTAEQLDSISRATSAMGLSGVEIKACEWTAFNCVSNPHEEFRGVIRNLVGTVLVMQSGQRTGAGGPAAEATDAAPGMQQGATDESRAVVPSGPRTAIGPAIR
jgi:hypothetical protein